MAVNNGRTHREVVDDVCPCLKKSYCLLKELILSGGPDDRTLEQFKCVEKFKYERGINGPDGGWEEALRIWREEGFAERFAQAYVPGETNKKIYDLIMQRITPE